MRDIAERILMHVQPRIGGDIDLPFGDVLPVMTARRHPQDLNYASGRRLVAIAGGMGNSQAHDLPGQCWSSDMLVQEDRHARSCTGHPRLSSFFSQIKTWMAGHRRAEATPSFGRLCPAMATFVCFRLESIRSGTVL